MSFFVEEEGVISNFRYVIKIPHLLLKGRKVVIGCRGWAYRGEYRRGLHRHLDSIGNMIADYGYYWASTDYGSGGYPLRKGLESLSLLIDLLRRKYNIEKIALFGVSMGGNIALLYAIEHPEDVDCIVNIYGVVDLIEQVKHVVSKLMATPLYVTTVEWSDVKTALKFLSDLKEELGGHPLLLRFNENYVKFSPLRRAAELTKPILIVHGECDNIVPINMSRMFVSELLRSGKKKLVKGFLRVKCGGHDERTIAVAMRSILSFLDKHLT